MPPPIIPETGKMGSIIGMGFPGYYPVPGSCFSYHPQFNMGYSSVSYPIQPSQPMGNFAGTIPNPAYYPVYQPIKPRSYAPSSHEISDRSADKNLAHNFNKLSFPKNENSFRNACQYGKRNAVLKATVDSRYDGLT